MCLKRPILCDVTKRTDTAPWLTQHNTTRHHSPGVFQQRGSPSEVIPGQYFHFPSWLETTGGENFISLRVAATLAL